MSHVELPALPVELWCLIFHYCDANFTSGQPYKSLQDFQYKHALQRAFPSCTSLLVHQWKSISCESWSELATLENFMVANPDQALYFECIRHVRLNFRRRAGHTADKTYYSLPLRDLFLRCKYLETLVWDLNHINMLEEYKLAIDKHQTLVDLTILADGPGEYYKFDYHKYFLPFCRTLRICTYPEASSWDDYFITWNHSDTIKTNQLLDMNPPIFSFDSKYPLGVCVNLASHESETTGQWNDGARARTSRDRQDLTFQFFSIIQNAEGILLRSSQDAGLGNVPLMQFVPCTADLIFVQKSIPIWLLVSDILFDQCQHYGSQKKFVMMAKRARAFVSVRSRLISSFTLQRATCRESCAALIRGECREILQMTPVKKDLEFRIMKSKIIPRLVLCEEWTSSRSNISCPRIDFCTDSIDYKCIFEMEEPDHARQIAHSLLSDPEICYCTSQIFLTLQSKFDMF